MLYRSALKSSDAHRLNLDLNLNLAHQLSPSDETKGLNPYTLNPISLNPALIEMSPHATPFHPFLMNFSLLYLEIIIFLKIFEIFEFFFENF